jgi:hypothetical protein
VAFMVNNKNRHAGEAIFYCGNGIKAD